MVVKQRAFERRQLAVEVGRSPAPRTLTLSVHGSHSSSDASTSGKLVGISVAIPESEKGMPGVEEDPDEDGGVVDRLVLLAERGPAQVAAAAEQPHRRGTRVGFRLYARRPAVAD